jgi:nitroimidazol reductase NimA-like FMN-containing flavoprotein (pyridoxamine 5'-phosphate oxidase superfamily)
MPGHSLDHAGLETLSFALCLRLLASVPVGRVGFVADGEVQVLPVNHVLDGQDVVFRTTHGSKLSAAEGEKPITFEVDDYDERTHSGWSVVVTGRSEPVDEDAEVDRLDRAAPRPWVSTVERPFWIRIRPTSVTGRRTPQAL